MNDLALTLDFPMGAGPGHKLRSSDEELLCSEGVRPKDQLCLVPMQGRNRIIPLLRKRFSLLTPHQAHQFNEEAMASALLLDSLGGEKFEFHLLLDEERQRYFINSASGQHFRINGVLTHHAYLLRGDKVQIGHNILRFSFPVAHAHAEASMLTAAVLHSDMSILLVGETGTGKTRLAREIYEKGKYLGPLVHLNLSALSPQLIESELFGHRKGAFTGAVHEKTGALLEANDGLLFLDEIDSLPWEIQTKLLLFLDDRQVRAVGGSGPRKSRARLVFASGQNLEKLVEQQKMRRDFYYRLTSGLTLNLQPLRLCPQKILQFCLEYSEQNDVSMSGALTDFYQRYPWPGNYRQISSHLQKKKLSSPGRRWELDALDWELEQKDYYFNTQFFEEDIGLVTLAEMKSRYAQWAYRRLGRNLSLTSLHLRVNNNTCKKLLGIS